MTKKIFAIMAIVLIGVGSVTARPYGTETLNYEIVYQWGMIWKHAANATLSITPSGGGYKAMLVGYTRSWADKIYPVRDTLVCTMDKDLHPLKYEKFTHEKDYYAIDEVVYSYGLGRTNAKCTRHRPNRPDIEDVNIELSARAQAYDMVSVFYMLREIDYNAKKAGDIISTIIFSGKQKEYLTLTYRGVEKVKLRDKSTRMAHKISFRFTQEGGKKSSENIDVWLSNDSNLVPLLLLGRMPVGEIKCYYKGDK